jgi:hypothetical protein
MRSLTPIRIASTPLINAESLHPEIRDAWKAEKQKDLEWFREHPGVAALIRPPCEAEQLIMQAQGRGCSYAEAMIKEGVVIIKLHWGEPAYAGERAALRVPSQGREKPKGFGGAKGRGPSYRP